MNSDVISVSRLLLIVITIILCITSIALTLFAVATPNWQIVYLVELQSEHFHGLWIDCVSRKFVQVTTASENMQCTYKFENAELISPSYSDTASVQNEEFQHKFHDWHKAVLTFFAISFICSIAAFCFTLCAACVRVCAIVSNVLHFSAFLNSLVAMIVFFINSHRIDVRFVHAITLTHEQFKGYSFYLAIFGVFGFLITFTVSILATVLIFLHDNYQHRQKKRKTFPKDTTVTSISV